MSFLWSRRRPIPPAKVVLEPAEDQHSLLALLYARAEIPTSDAARDGVRAGITELGHGADGGTPHVMDAVIDAWCGQWSARVEVAYPDVLDVLDRRVAAAGTVLTHCNTLYGGLRREHDILVGGLREAYEHLVGDRGNGHQVIRGEQAADEVEHDEWGDES